jgi:hypothetical protein
MFKFVPNTGVPGLRVGLPEGLDQRTPAGAADPRAYDYYPYGDATLASGDPSGVGTNPPTIFSPWAWPARPRPLETIPMPDPGARSSTTLVRVVALVPLDRPRGSRSDTQASACAFAISATHVPSTPPAALAA